jgi:hypothetical protein
MKRRSIIAAALLVCRGNPDELKKALQNRRGWLVACLLLIVVGSGIYGATIGLWRSSLQAIFTGIKFPMVVVLTTLGNAVINGMTAQVVGTGLTFRQSSLAILTSFALQSVILGSLSPVTLFIWANTPPLSAGDAFVSHSCLLLSHVFLIALGGIISNITLFRMLNAFCGDRGGVLRVLGSWLVMNLFLGCQISWFLRPFVGSPGLPVQFLRNNAFEGNFYEITLQSLQNLAKRI